MFWNSIIFFFFCISAILNVHLIGVHNGVVSQDLVQTNIMHKVYNTTLVVLFGSMRGGPMAWNSLRKHVLNPLGADLALLTDFGTCDKGLWESAKLRWHVEEVRDWGVYMDFYNKSRAWRDTFCVDGKNNNQFSGVIPRCGTGVGSGVIGLVFREEMRRRLPEIPDHYEWIVFQRSDFLFECDHPDISAFDPNIVHIKSTGYRPVTDRAMIVHRNMADRALGIVPFMFSNSNLWVSKLLVGGIEVALSNYFSAAHIAYKHYPVPAGIVKRSVDSTRWNRGQVAKELKPFGLLRKYWDSDKGVVRKICHKVHKTEAEYRELV